MHRPFLRWSVAKPTGLIGWIGLCLIFLGPQEARADVVYLTSGRTMEGIVVEETDQQVRLRLPFGELGLPRSSIIRIDRQASVFQDYLEQRQSLRQGNAPATEWLDLANWAATAGLDHSAREAALVAARREPELPGLAPLMRGLGYAFDEQLVEWLPFDDLMRRRGYVESDGRWLTAREARELQETQQASLRRRLEQERQERLTQAMELMVMAQMVQAEETRRLREEATAYPGGLPLYGFPTVVWPGYWPRPPHRPGRHGTGGSRSDRKAYQEAFIDRPPGSWIPVSPKANRGGIGKTSGSH